MRNFNSEYQDTEDRLYAYNFDYIMHHYMLKSFQPWIKPGKALEMGCYQGEFTRLLSEQYQDITVMEGSSKLIQETKNNLANANIKYIHNTFESASIAEKFDAIFLIHTLEHLDDSVAVLKKINSWLSERGILFLVVPNAYAASRQLAVKMDLISFNNAVSEGEWAHGHRRTYSFDILERDAKIANLNIISRGGIFFKAVSNRQLDLMMKHEIINHQYLDACYVLGQQYPELCASIFLICSKGKTIS